MFCIPNPFDRWTHRRPTFTLLEDQVASLDQKVTWQSHALPTAIGRVFCHPCSPGFFQHLHHRQPQEKLFPPKTWSSLEFRKVQCFSSFNAEFFASVRRFGTFDEVETYILKLNEVNAAVTIWDEVNIQNLSNIIQQNWITYPFFIQKNKINKFRIFLTL